MKKTCVLRIFLFLLFATTHRVVECARPIEEYLRTSRPLEQEEDIGTRWAVLFAGSNGYENYRHQANVCHAYQVLKQGGLKDENIIVFMYDDIAYNEENPTPGFIFNKPYGPDVYQHVPKDYTGNDTNANNLYAVLFSNKYELTGGSGKVLSSGPDDHIFFYYTDHGGPGYVGTPLDGEYVFGSDLVEAVMLMQESRMFKRMTMYVEACYSGSMLSGLLPDDVDVYATTSSSPDQESMAYYCPGDGFQFGTANSSTHTPPPPGSPEYFKTCLGDLYSVSWLEDSDVHDPRKETLKKQYERVKERTDTSDIMQYGDKRLSRAFRSYFMGQNYPYRVDGTSDDAVILSSSSSGALVSQPDAKLAYLRHKLQSASDGTPEKAESQKMLDDELLEREQVDHKIEKIAKLLFGEADGLATANTVRPDGQPLVDDWDCFKTSLSTYEDHCGALSHYGRKYARAMANMCNAGISRDRLIQALAEAC